jgi:hypothetical protein
MDIVSAPRTAVVGTAEWITEVQFQKASKAFT